MRARTGSRHHADHLGPGQGRLGGHWTQQIEELSKTRMELKEAIGIRRTIRFYNPYRPVEREKIQKMLEAARIASFWGNVQALRAIVMFKGESPQEKWDALVAPL